MTNTITVPAEHLGSTWRTAADTLGHHHELAAAFDQLILASVTQLGARPWELRDGDRRPVTLDGAAAEVYALVA